MKPVPRSPEQAEVATDLLDRCRWGGTKVTWDDVVGHESAKRELKVVAEQIRRQSTAERLGLTAVKGILLMGPAGSGKTMLAKALATSVGRPTYVIPASEVDARTLRRVYESLAEQPALVIWDEVDVLIRNRWGRNAPEEGRLAAAFCAALDGVESIAGPITVGLTAEDEWSLDRTAIRAGRLTTKIVLDLPDREERRRLWERYVAQVPVIGAIDFDKVADRSGEMSGAEISAAVMVAVGLSMVDGVDALTPGLLDEVLLRRHHVTEPAEKRTEQDLRRSAIHEFGHAVYAALVFGHDAVASVSLADVGDDSGGRTRLTDRFRGGHAQSRELMVSLAGMAFAGYVAEEFAFGPTGVSAGCTDDVAKATQILRQLASSLGASDTIGLVDLDGIERGEHSDRGAAEMRYALWEAVRLDARRSLDGVRQTLAGWQTEIEALAETLVAADNHTLSGRELAAAFGSMRLPSGSSRGESSASRGPVAPGSR